MAEQALKEKQLVPSTKKEVSLAKGIAPQDFADLYRFADLVQKSRLAPKSFDSTEKIAVGILTNMELGRPIITGLQDLAIINGRCGIYGDASLAMVTASGLMEPGYPIEEETGEPYTPEWTFIFKVKRKDGPERVGKWTWADSIKAGFDQPKQRDGSPDRFSPWARFPRRMMQWKARNYVLRDTFGDVLKGMKTVEDLHDMDAVPMELAPNGTYKASATPESITEAIRETSPGEQAGEILAKAARDKKEKDDPPAADQADPNDDAQEEFGDDHPWARENWANKRTGDGIRTGYAGFVNENIATFHEAPEQLQKEARDKWIHFYKDATWPGDVPPGPGLATKEDLEEDPFHEGDPAAEEEVPNQKVGQGVLESADEAKTKWPNKEELEAEAAIQAKQNVKNLNAIRKFPADVRQAAYDKAGLNAPVLLSTEKFEKVAEVLEYCNELENGPPVIEDNGDRDDMIELIREFDIEAREPAFKRMGIPLSAELRSYPIERVADLYKHCAEEAKKILF